MTTEDSASAVDITLKSAPEDRAVNGPFDDSEAPAVRPYIDLGAIKVLPRDGMNLRLEIDEKSQRVVAVALDLEGSTLQVQAFAAPRSTGLWNEIRENTTKQLQSQKIPVSEAEGPLGIELRTEVAAVSADGKPQRREVRFLGVDGPRWFLQGVIGGAALTDPVAADAIEELFRSLVVVRGSTPMPPRDLLPLQVPKAAAAQ